MSTPGTAVPDPYDDRTPADPEWFTRVLREASALSDGSVVAVRAQPVGNG